MCDDVALLTLFIHSVEKVTVIVFRVLGDEGAIKKSSLSYYSIEVHIKSPAD